MTVKLRKSFGVVFVVFGLLLSLIPFKLVPVCTKLMANGMPMPCNHTGKIEVLLGFLLIAVGILIFFIGKKVVQVLLGVASVVIGLLGIAFPLFITGGCKNRMMACHIHSFPAIYLVSGIVAVLGAVVIFLAVRHAD